MDSPAPTPPRSRSLSVTAQVFAAVSAVLLLLILLVTIVLPYGDYDAMGDGTWSRFMGLHLPTYHFPGIGAMEYQRPVFFVLQGLVWRLFGYHMYLGRLTSFSFALLLIGTIAWLAAGVARPYRWLAATLAIVVLLMVTPFERYVSAGMTDVPVAAMVALTAAVLLARRLGRAHLPLLVVVATLTVLTKPSAAPALAALGVAALVGPRDGLRRRAYACAALAGGCLIALAYDWSQAQYLHVGLRGFLMVGTTGPLNSSVANQVRRTVLLDGSWLGDDLRILLWFAVVYAIVRVVGAQHRLAVVIALPVAAVWSWLGPHLALGHGLRVGILGTGGATQQIAVLVLTASILFALNAPPEVVPDRLTLGRLLIWMTPTLVLWGKIAVYNTRLLAPAWPPLILLITWTLLPALAGAVRRSQWLVVIPAAAIVALGAMAAYDINGLGQSGWSQLRAGGISSFSNAAAMRDIGMGGDFAAEIDAVEPQVRSGDRILTYDDRLKFFYLDQVDISGENSCSQLPGHRLFVLLEDDELQKIYGNRASSAFWEACKNVSLTKVAERPGAFALFVNGTPIPQAGGCSVNPPNDQGLAIEFGRMRTAAEAAALQKHVAAAGFVQAKVEQLGCSLYRVVETGVPSQAVGESIVAEAKNAGIAVKLVTAG